MTQPCADALARRGNAQRRVNAVKHEVSRKNAEGGSTRYIKFLKNSALKKVFKKVYARPRTYGEEARVDI